MAKRTKKDPAAKAAKKDPHPQLVEAQKTLDTAKQTYVNAVHSIEGQYLKSLLGIGEVAGVNAIRSQYTKIPDAAVAAGSGHKQPTAPRAEKTKARKAPAKKKAATKKTAAKPAKKTPAKKTTRTETAEVVDY
jgi:hypothetical protein